MFRKKDDKAWQPDKKKVKEITKEIKGAYDKAKNKQIPEKEFIKNCAKIGAFLEDTPAVERQLSKLEELLDKKIMEIQSKNPSEEIKVSVLTTILKEELEKLGFKSEFSKALDLVEPAHFRKAIFEGFLVKDISLGHDPHGEFSHIIQWLLIGWQQKENQESKNKFLSCSVIDMYKGLGEEKSVIHRTVDPETKKTKERNIWDHIVDIFGDKNFKNPDHMQRVLQKDEKKQFPRLQYFIEKRVQKREKDIQDKEKGGKGPIHLREKYANSSRFYKNPETGENILLPIEGTNKVEADKTTTKKK